MNSCPARHPFRARCLAFSLLPAICLLAAGELVARLLHPGEVELEHQFRAPEGYFEYFGTRRVWVPFEMRPPFYWLPAAGPPISNNRGFRGRDWHESKPPGVVRIANLGDSCTQQGQESYPERLDRLLRDALGGGRYEVLNAGVGASSTHQMLQIFERHVLPMSPDVVVVFLGWNDRWVNDGLRDASHRVPGPWLSRLREGLATSRLYQICSRALERWRHRRVEPRVPPEETAANLRRFADLCRERGIRLYLATTPDGMPDEGIVHRFTKDKPEHGWVAEFNDQVDRAGGPVAQWRGLHRLYNDALRSVAAERSVPVIDLDTALAERRSGYPEPPLYLFRDGVHLTELGLQEVARLLALALLAGRERDRVVAYTESAPYHFTNAVVFARQHQYAAAAAFLEQAAARGPLPAEAGPLREEIARERPFFDRLDNARIRQSLGADPAWVLAELQACLSLRPLDEDLRLDTAQRALELGRLSTAIELTLSHKAYSPEGLYRALWIAAESADQSGQRELQRRILGSLNQAYPQDERVRKALAVLRSD